MINLDFETRSHADVTETGPHVYAAHKSTDVVCLCWCVDDGPVNLWHPFGGDRKIPKGLKLALESGHKLGAYNRMFETCIWREVMVGKYGWPEIEDSRWVCSAALGAAMALPRSLEKLGLALKLTKLKNMEGKRVMLKVSQPRKPTKTDPTTPWHEKPEDLNRVFAYCKDDVETEREAAKVLAPLSSFEHKIWTLDQQINRRGVHIDRTGVEAALFLIDEYKKELWAELSEITKGQVQTHAALASIHAFIEAEGVNLPNMQAQTVEEFLAGAHEETAAVRVLQIRSLLGKSSTTKYQAMLNRMGPDNRVRDILVYCGASTGRWAGSGIQIQNLPAGRGLTDQATAIEAMKMRDLDHFKMLFDNPLKTISACIRGMLCASEGAVLRSIDYNAIEARVIFWLAGCQLGLSEFREAKPIYKLMAAEVFNVNLEDVTEEMRDLGKRIVLGAGFGMGWRKFVITCKTQGNKEIEPELAQKGINAYRMRYAEVPKFWRALEDAALRCVLGGEGQCVAVGLLTFTMHKEFMTITLPSGRPLYYWRPSVKEHDAGWGPKPAVYFWFVDSQTKQWVEGSSYGGLWAENVTQACARDVMAPAMLAVEKAGHKIIFSVHDEIVMEDNANFSSLKNAEQVMLGSLPTWASGLPIVVKGWQDTRYKKG